MMHGQSKRTTANRKSPTVARRPRGLVTRERILDSAERVFSTQGPGASLRTIMDEADVNVASIHYHFGSRENLLEQIIERRAIIINRERLTLLDQATQQHPNDVSAILRALVQPAITLAMKNESGWLHYFRLLGRLEANAEDIYGAIMSNYYVKMHFAFLNALSKALPSLSNESLVWRYYFVVAVMSRASTSLESVRQFSKGKIKPKTAEDVLKELIPSLTALLVGGYQGMRIS